MNPYNELEQNDDHEWISDKDTLIYILSTFAVILLFVLCGVIVFPFIVHPVQVDELQTYADKVQSCLDAPVEFGDLSQDMRMSFCIEWAFDDR